MADDNEKDEGIGAGGAALTAGAGVVAGGTAFVTAGQILAPKQLEGLTEQIKTVGAKALADYTTANPLPKTAIGSVESHAWLANSQEAVSKATAPLTAKQSSLTSLVTKPFAAFNGASGKTKIVVGSIIAASALAAAAGTYMYMNSGKKSFAEREDERRAAPPTNGHSGPA